MLDQKVLASCLDSRKAYDRVRDHVVEEELSPQARAWMPLIREWYARDRSATAVDRGILRERAKRAFPEKHKETLLAWFDDLGESVSPENVATELLDLKRHVAGMELQQLMASGAPRDKLAAAVRRYEALLEAADLHTSEANWCDDDDEMERMLDPSGRIPLCPDALNKRAGGGAVPGDHILIFGRPEAGKTLFTVNMVAGFLKSGRRVLYIGNEESLYKTRKRVITNLLRCTPEQYDNNRTKGREIARQRGLDRLRMLELTPGTISEIDYYLEEVQPDVLVLDQIRNIRGGGDKLTQRLEQVATDVRSLLKKHGAIGVSVTQAGDKTERHGQEVPIWLSMSDVDSSRTGLPAQVDLMIGIGVNEDLRAQGQRAISLPKNKLHPGGSHEGFLVSVDTLRSIVS
jgi:KaiC/GvpD/RAD55 family RecA-like ATPase